MSPEFDLDRLADYTAGVLDRDETERVARLIASDATWARAHAALVEADASVRSDLREEAWTELGPMPADVVVRLDQALAREALARDTPTGPTGAAARSGSRDASDALPAVASLDEARRRRRPGLSGGGRRRLAVGITAAAAAVIAVVGGVGVVAQQLGSPAGTTAAQPDAGAPGVGGSVRSEAEAPALGPVGPALVSSGKDYGRTTVDQVARSAVTSAARPAPSSGEQPQVHGAPGAPDELHLTVPGPLARLAEPAALAACLSAVQKDHPGTPAVVDYARYEGAPALLILLVTAESSAVVVVGPDCGVQRHADETAFALVD